MADIDDTESTRKKTRKLPPLKLEQVPNGEANEGERKPRRKKKKPPEENGEAMATAPENAETPRKKKRKSRDPEDSSGNAGYDAPKAAQPEGETSRKKTRRKKPVDEQLESPQRPEEVVDATQGSEGTEKLVKKKRRKRKTPAEFPEETPQGRYNEGLAAELHDMEDDVIDAGGHEGMPDEEEEEEKPHKVSHRSLQSEAENALYIEKKNRFLREDKTKLAKRLVEEDERRREAGSLTFLPSKDTLQFALATHHVFRKFALICHGLLAGAALAHCVLISLWSTRQGYWTFLEIYTGMAMPIHELYYFLLLICTVSACDRFDLAGMTRSYFLKCISFQNGAISTVFYLVALIISLSMVHHDDKINYFSSNETVWSNEEEGSAVLNEYRILSAVRAGFVVVGWMILALQPSTDRLKLNLVAGDENVLGEDVPVELNRISAA